MQIINIAYRFKSTVEREVEWGLQIFNVMLKAVDERIKQ